VNACCDVWHRVVPYGQDPHGFYRLVVVDRGSWDLEVLAEDGRMIVVCRFRVNERDERP